jgi:hypothetical protein
LSWKSSPWCILVEVRTISIDFLSGTFFERERESAKVEVGWKNMFDSARAYIFIIMFLECLFKNDHAFKILGLNHSCRLCISFVDQTADSEAALSKRPPFSCSFSDSISKFEETHNL